jgi:hypothetical protein
MRIVLISLLASAGALRLAIPHTKKTSDATSFGELEQEGSKDFEELKSALKQMEPYVFIRDHGNLLNQKVPTKVLLGVDSPPIRPYKSGDFYEGRAPKHAFNGKMLNTVKYQLSQGHTCEIGFSKVGDDYYDPKWAADMLERRRKNSDGLWVLSDEDHFYELLYHSIVQWPGSPEKAHQSELSHMAHKIGVKYSGSNMNSNSHDKKVLKEFMTKHNYKSTNPFHKTPKFPTTSFSRQVFPSGGNVSKTHCKKIHFIHIGKTGGTTVKSWLRQAYPGIREGISDKYVKKSSNTVDLSRWNFKESQFMLHGHGFRLGDGGPDDCYVTFVRDPVERWVSGFLSRARKASNGKGEGLWGPDEEFAYTHFSTPEKLAQGLFSNDAGRRAEAKQAHNGLHHTKEGIAWYLPNIDKYVDRLLFVGETHAMEEDFKRMCEVSGLPAGHPLEDLDARNEAPEKQQKLKHLTPKSEENLKHFLKKDYDALDKLAKYGLLTTEAKHEDAVTGGNDEHLPGFQNRFSLMVDNTDSEADEDAV